MDFSNWVFWLIVLPYVCIMSIVCRQFCKDDIRRIVSQWSLLILNLTLLGVVSLETLGIFLFVTVMAYIGCRYVQQSCSIIKTLFLWIIIPILLIPLAYYKYADFISTEILRQEWDTFKDLIIPIGISFYTFQVISFCIDTLRRNQQVPSFIEYMNFCSFFPQIVAGPIERKDSLLPQMAAWQCKLSPSLLAEGIPYIILGLFFKLALADNLAQGMHIGYTGHNAFQVWANNIAFGFRIYFDFAGYGLSAYGVAKCLGVNITMNFMSPYTTSNVTEFWRKWHISLTLWFRDYIYFSLGGSRTRFWWFNIIIMFLISGVWHGAGWNFIIWGGLAGVTMVIHRIFRNTGKTLPGIIGWIMTMGTMMFIWMFFYETDMSIVANNFCTITNTNSYNIKEYIQILNENKTQGACMYTFVSLSFVILALEYFSRRRTDNPYAIFLSPKACVILILLISMFHSEQSSQFIYFAF
ncbi:MAG: MBOAT family protein [Akkermansia sp.]|nr:MBOAT family protein [Akkermansia sp.]